MLVLSRLVDETVCIGGNLIKVTVVRVKGDRVWLGFDAPDEIPIWRQEVQVEIDQEQADV